MSKALFQDYIKKALVLDAQERASFLDEINNHIITKRVCTLLSNDAKLTQFAIETCENGKSDTLINDFQAGDRINQFVIKRLIAKGGMGSVFLAFDEKLRRNVAIKAIRSEFLNDLHNRERFKREAQILSQINHPSICQIHDSIETKNGSLLILEYIQGKILAKCELSKKQMLDVFIQIASALKAAHDKGVIHRDLKPDNILVNSENEVKILDFGIAKLNNFSLDDKCLVNKMGDSYNFETPELTKAGSLMGTLMYMSPEQVNLKKVMQSSDVYTFGVILQQTLTGCSTYNFEDTLDLEQQIKSANIVNTDSVPKKYFVLLSSMLRSDPIKRPSATDVLTQLRQIKNHQQEKKENSKKLYLLIFIYAIIGLLVWQFVSNSNKAKREKLIININNQIKTIKNDLQNIYTLPIHNTTSDLKKITGRHEDNILIINTIDSLQNFQKDYLLGKSYLSINNLFKAIPYLEKSWQGNPKDENIAKDLSYAYSLNYLEKFKEYKDLYGSGKSKKFKILTDNYISKIKNIEEIISLEKESSISNALLLWHNNKSQKAIQVLDSIINSQDWQFGAYTLKAFFLKAKADKERSLGNNIRATTLLTQALSTYIEAISRGRSFIPAYEGSCRTNLEVISDAVNRTNKDISVNFFEGTKACKDVLEIDENINAIYGLLSKYNYYYSYYKKQKGQTAEEYLTKALEWNTKALLNENNYLHYNSQAEILTLQAQLKLAKGENPLIEVKKSIRANLKAADLSGNKNGYLYSSIIYTLLVKLEYELLNGMDTSKTIGQAQNYFKIGFDDSISNYRKKFFILNNAQAHYLHAKALVVAKTNPETTIKEIENIIIDENNIFQSEPNSLNILASSYFQLALFKRNNGNVDINLVQKALTYSNKANNLLTNDSILKSMNANLLLEMELSKLEIDKYYILKLGHVKNGFAQAIKLNPKAAGYYANLANLHLQEVLEMSDLKAKLEEIQNGIKACQNAININPNHAFALKIKALLITHAVKVGLFSKKEEINATKLFERAYAINPLLK